MSEDIYYGVGMIVTRFVGPAQEGPDRQRWQFTPQSGREATLSRDELLELDAELVGDLYDTRAAARG